MDLQFANCDKSCLDLDRRQQHECSGHWLRGGRSISPIISAFVFFLFFISSVRSLNFNHTSQDFRPSKKLKFIRAHLSKINKPAVKTIQVTPLLPSDNYLPAVTIPLLFCPLPCFVLFCFYSNCFRFAQSPDGDTIDCVPSHKQPAFDHPKLIGQKPLVIMLQICVF